MPSGKYQSPCCGAPSIIRTISLETRELALRCTVCAQLRIEKLGKKPAPAQSSTRLRLIVNR